MIDVYNQFQWDEAYKIVPHMAKLQLLTEDEYEDNGGELPG